MPQDKNGATVSKGDVVEFFYGGDRHEAVVEDVTTVHGVEHLSVRAYTAIPASASRLTKSADKKPKAHNPQPPKE